MELVLVPFSSAQDFLLNAGDNDRPTLFYPTRRDDLLVGSALLVELSYPGLPSATLMRTVLRELHPGLGYTLAVMPRDQAAFRFACRLARGDEDAAPMPRIHPRVPAELPVDCRIDGQEITWTAGRTQNLSAGGAFIRSREAPDIGSRVRMVLGPTPHGDRFVVYGEVTSCSDDGFAVKFSSRDLDAARLRRTLRKSAESGTMAFS